MSALVPRAAPTAPRSPRGGLRPWAREPRRRAERRLCRRLAAGLTPAQAARAEGVEETEVETLLADPDFAALVDEFRALQALPEAEARALLLRLARGVLEEAAVEGDVRVALFIWREETRGRDPAATLADGVVAASRHAARPPAPVPAPPPPETPPPARAPRPPAHPADRIAWRTAARLREALVAEHATIRRCAPPSPRPSPILRTGEGANPAARGSPHAPSPSQRERVGVRAPPPSPVAPAMGGGRGEGGQPADLDPPKPPPLNRHQRRRRAALDRRGRAATARAGPL
jgi:hypothetical protein